VKQRCLIISYSDGHTTVVYLPEEFPHEEVTYQLIAGRIRHVAWDSIQHFTVDELVELQGAH